jgi:pantetheine-phosphate adenylyltransferase
MKAFFPGSFNPFTTGHLDLLARALTLFPEGVVVGIGYNEHKTTPADIAAREATLKSLLDGVAGVEVMSYDGLTINAVRRTGAGVIIRGFRNAIDAEYERSLADANRMISGIDTILLPASPELAAVSSSMVRELQHNHFDTSRWVPDASECRRRLATAESTH